MIFANGVPMDPTWAFSWYTDPVFLGHYPGKVLKFWVPCSFTDDDMAIISQPLISAGWTLYWLSSKSACSEGAGVPTDGFRDRFYGPSRQRYCIGVPDTLERYGKAILCNGMWVAVGRIDGPVEDPQRIHFLKQCEQYRGFWGWNTAVFVVFNG